MRQWSATARRKLTRAEEQILQSVRRANDRGALCGLGVGPSSAHYGSPAFRFVKRLADHGEIVWVAYTPRLGAGWAVAGSPLAAGGAP